MEQENHIARKTRHGNKEGQPCVKSKGCFRCGRERHFARGKSCPAKSAKCRKCQKNWSFGSCMQVEDYLQYEAREVKLIKKVSKRINFLDQEDEYDKCYD